MSWSFARQIIISLLVVIVVQQNYYSCQYNQKILRLFIFLLEKYMYWKFNLCYCACVFAWIVRIIKYLVTRCANIIADNWTIIIILYISFEYRFVPFSPIVIESDYENNIFISRHPILFEIILRILLLAFVQQY